MWGIWLLVIAKISGTHENLRGSRKVTLWMYPC